MGGSTTGSGEKYKILDRVERGVARGLVNVWLDLCVNLTDVGIAPQRSRGDGWQGEV